MTQPTPHEPLPEHGAHTLEVVEGVVVGVDAREVFVELGPRRTEGQRRGRDARRRRP